MSSEQPMGDAMVQDSGNGTSSKTAPSSTPEGMFLAYGSLLIMAVVPIIVGSFRSVKSHEQQRETSRTTGEKPETMTSKDAAMFPLIASAALLGLYIFFQVFSKEYVNLLLSGYFLVLGVLALTHAISPLSTRLFSSFRIPLSSFRILFTKEEQQDNLMDYTFTTHDIATLGFCSIFGGWYLWKKHWIANNILGIAFSINGVELLHLNSVMTGCILLGGLFFYDVFWVFGTDVMVTVAKSFDAPIKLIFPHDLLQNGFFGASNMAMLGLGDIVIPGIFVALLLRYDHSLQRGSRFYFYTTLIAYIAGLVTTILVMHFFKHAQPALLYLVPSCISFPLGAALLRGDIKSLISYEDHPSEESDDTSSKKDD